MLLALFLALPVWVCGAEHRFEHRSLPPDGGERAVLVLAPGMNGDGGHFLQEEAWLNFAREQQLGVIALSYRSPVEGLYGQQRKGYYWPEQGSGEALQAEVRRLYGKDLPLLLYGFSGGAHFVSRFAEWAPEQVMGWAAYSAQFWDAPVGSKADAPAGMVVCGDWDGVRWFASFAHFYAGRELDRPWVWVSLPETGHVRHRALEELIREYFRHALEGNEGQPVYADVMTGERVGELLLEQKPLTARLPSEVFYQNWRAIHGGL